MAVTMREFSGGLAAFVCFAFWITRTSYIAPHAWNHDVDTISWVTTHKWFFILPSLVYIPLIFGLQFWLRDRKPFDLGGSGTKATFNYIFWWEAALALFSILGALITVPVAFERLWDGRISWVELICNPAALDRSDPRSFWGLLFVISKVPELGDTLFIVLRKKELVLLQWYHHLLTLILLAFGTVAFSKHNNVGLLFTAMNYTVHAFMYSWYASTRIGWKSPKLIMMIVTLMQLSQMFAGLVFTFIASSDRYGAECGRWAKESPWTLKLTYGMYASYAFLFAKLFVENYIVKKKRKHSDKKLGKAE